jgi:hypothetical protein
MMKTVSLKSIAVIFGAGAIVLAAGLFPCSVAHAQDDGWGKWEKNPSDGGTLRKWSGGDGYKHCSPSHLSGKQAFAWECRPCEGAASGYQNYCWIGYSFDFMTCDPPSQEQGYRVETYYRKTQKRCGPEEQKKTADDGDRWNEVSAKDNININGTPKEVPVEQPPTDSSGPSTADGVGTVPEDDTSFHKKEADEKNKPKTEKTATPSTGTPSTDTGKVEKRPRKEVKRTTKLRRAKTENGQSTSAGGVSPEAASAIGTAVGIGIGMGVGMGNRGGMMREGGSRGDTMR